MLKFLIMMNYCENDKILTSNWSELSELLTILIYIFTIGSGLGSAASVCTQLIILGSLRIVLSLNFLSSINNISHLLLLIFMPGCLDKESKIHCPGPKSIVLCILRSLWPEEGEILAKLVWLGCFDVA